MLKFSEKLVNDLRAVTGSKSNKFKILELASSISNVQEVLVEIPKINYIFEFRFQYFKSDKKIFFARVGIRTTTYQSSDFGNFIAGGEIISVALNLKIDYMDIVTALRYAESVLLSYEFDLDYNEPLKARKKAVEVES